MSVATEIERLLSRIDSLEGALFDVALLADGHRRSRVYDETGANIALSVILAHAAAALGRTDVLRERGTLFASTVDRSGVEA
jgi:hypothetical protein